MRSVIFLSLLNIWSLSACTFEGCDHVDYGSCGNACCRLNIEISAPSEEVMNMLNASIVSGGPDSRYIPMITADGLLTFRDLRSKNNGVDFLGQAFHTTADLKYNDTLDILLRPSSDKLSTNIFAFSISNIGGAYGDSGQNYFNIIQLFNSVFGEGKYGLAQADKSCPAPL